MTELKRRVLEAIAWRPASDAASYFVTCMRGTWPSDFLAANFAFYREQANPPFDALSRPDVDISCATVTLDNPILDEGHVAIRGVRTGSFSFRTHTIEAFA